MNQCFYSLPFALICLAGCGRAEILESNSSLASSSDAEVGNSSGGTESTAATQATSSESTADSDKTVASSTAEDSESSASSHDPRCDLRYYDNEGSLCGSSDGQLWWGVYRPLHPKEIAATCWPSHFGPVCDDPTYGHPFKSIEECMDACPDAINIVEDNFKVQECDITFSVPVSYENAHVDVATGMLSVEYTAVLDCPLFGPHFQICSDTSRNSVTADGLPRVYLRVQFDDPADWCDGASGGHKQTYDISSVLAEVTERPFSIILDAAQEDFTLLVE